MSFDSKFYKKNSKINHHESISFFQQLLCFCVFNHSKFIIDSTKFDVKKNYTQKLRSKLLLTSMNFTNRFSPIYKTTVFASKLNTWEDSQTPIYCTYAINFYIFNSFLRVDPRMQKLPYKISIR